MDARRVGGKPQSTALRRIPRVAVVRRGLPCRAGQRYNPAPVDRTNGDPPGPATPEGASPSDRLDSWKEIAAYLKRDITTVQRWEKREGMPVRRHQHEKLGTVYAFRSELDAWLGRRHPAGAPSPAAGDAPLDERRAASPTIAPPDRPPVSAPGSARARRPHRWAVAAALLAVALAGASWWLWRSEYFWRSPLDGAEYTLVTDFGGAEQAAAVSPDGRFVAFLSDRDGRFDVWVTQLGTGQYANLTRGRVRELVNPSVRTLGFSPDGALVTFWARGVEDAGRAQIGVWAIPTLGGSPRPYLEDAAEFAWSPDGGRVVYHSTDTGDPTFVRAEGQAPRRVFAADSGRHAHFPTWSPDGAFLYLVLGEPPDAMDIWRIPQGGGAPERITFHEADVSHPVFLDRTTLLYLVRDRDAPGARLHGVDVRRRRPHRLGTPLEQYSSLSASRDGRRLVATLARTKSTLWQVAPATQPDGEPTVTPVALPPGRGFAPRFGPGFLVFASPGRDGDTIWRLSGDVGAPIWSAAASRITGGPEVAADGARIAVAVEQHGTTRLWVMNADGTSARVLDEVLDVRGSPTWAPDGQSVVSGAIVDGTPQLVRVPLTGGRVALVREYALDPAWSPRGDAIVYSGADVGTAVPVKAIAPDGRARPVAAVALTRGARRLRFLPGGRALVMLRGDLRHKDLWTMDLDTGAERRLITLPDHLEARDFDIFPDGRIVVESVQRLSDVVLIDR